MELKVGDKLRYKGGYSDYELGGEYEIASTATLGYEEEIYYVDNGEREDEWERDELLEHFDVLDKPQQPQANRVELQQADADMLDAWLNHTAYSVVNDLDEQYAQGVKKGILLTLDAYGIKVKGIND